MIAAANCFLKFLGKGHCCIKQFKVQKRFCRSEDKNLTKAEYERLVKTARDKGKERLSLIIQTICSCGLRVSEVKYVTAEAVMTGEATVTCKGKSRTVWLPSALRSKLRKYIRKNKITHGPVFVTGRGRAISRFNIWREMKALCKEAGVESCKVFPHNLRHLFARTFCNIEKDISKLADILGHSSIETTRIYISDTGENQRRRLESMRLIL